MDVGPVATRIAAVVLAAGGSTRMGRPKALLPLDGVPLAVGHVRAFALRARQVAVAVGASEEAIAAVLPPGTRVVRNPDWATTGPRESLLLALAALELDESDWLLVTPVDLPPAPPSVIDLLLAAGPPAVAAYEGRRGHPVLVRVGDARAALAVGTLREATRDARHIDVGWAGAVMNLNRPADWAGVRP